MTTVYRIKMNGIVLQSPIFFRWDDAMAEKRRLKELNGLASIDIEICYE